MAPARRDGQRRRRRPGVLGGDGVTATLSGLTITGGSTGGDGGGMYNGRHADGHRLHLVSNSATAVVGGGIFNCGHDDDHQLHHRRQLGAHLSGGGINNAGTITAINCTIAEQRGRRAVGGWSL